MAKVTFNTDLCKGCGLCVEACPKHILAIARDKINKKGYSPAEMTGPVPVHRLRLLRHHVPGLHHHRGKVEEAGEVWQNEY